MKTLKFTPQLSQDIIDGKKTSTFRLFDDKDLKEGDEIVFVNKETMQELVKGKITLLKIKTLGTLEENNFDGHREYESKEAMYEEFKKFYGERVNEDSEVKIIKFEFSKIKKTIS